MTNVIKQDRLVSVIIPTYNREKLILRSVNSVLAQTYGNIEVIVIDDCSTDQTGQIVSSIKDARLKYERLEKNSGACAARNRGIDLAAGEIICFQDSDDVWNVDKIEKQIKKLSEEEADICFCRMQAIDTVTGKISYIPDDDTEPELTYERLLLGNYISTQMLMARRECFEEIRFDVSLPRYQDWDLVLRLAGRYRMVYVPSVLVDQYIQSDSISKSGVKLARATALFFEKHESEYQKYPGLYTKMLRDVSRNLAKNHMEAGRYYKKLWKTEKSVSSLVKVVTYQLGILPLYYRIRTKSK